MSVPVLGLDIGGANLKAAHSTGAARLVPYSLWKGPAGLSDALRGLLRDWPPFEQIAVTMTGELCDCFENKRQGVHAILDAVERVCERTTVQVWRTDGQLVDIATARSTPLLTAAANWLALATFACRHAQAGTALLVDIGSTTTDIVPLSHGKPIPRGRTDPERLQNQEMVYTGIRRTPLCALLGAEGAAELFATTLDVYLILGKLPEDATDSQTADGRPATRAAAHARLARMICADLESCTEDERRNLALRACNRQALLIRNAIERVLARLPRPLRTVVLAGSGEFLGRAALEIHGRTSPSELAPERLVSLGEVLGPEISQAACAYALAVLASERSHGE